MGWVLWRLLCTLVLALAVSAAGARDRLAAPTALRPLVVPATAAPVFTVYGSQDGLEDGAWNAVAQDARGLVWTGSDNGLAWFDGYRWHAAALPVPNSPIMDLATAPDGALWALLGFSGYARYDGRRWTTGGKADEFGSFQAVGSGPGRLLVATGQTGVWQLEGNRWRKDFGDPAQAGIRPSGFAQTRRLFGEPRQWLGDINGGLWYRRVEPAGFGPWQRFHHPVIDRLIPGRLFASRNDAGQEELWFIPYNNGLVRLRDDGIRVWKPGEAGVPATSMHKMVETRGATGQRDLWIATRAGLLRIHGPEERIDRYDRRDGLPSDVIKDVMVQTLPDGSQALWLATEQGMVRATLGRGPWTVVTRMGEQGNGVFGVIVEPDGRGGERLWVAAPVAGLALLDAGKWRHFNAANGALPQGTVSGLFRLPGPDGRPHRLVAFVGASLYEINDRFELVPFDTPWSIAPNVYASSMLARRIDGAIEWWVGVRGGGIFRWRDGRWTAYRTQGAEAAWTVYDLSEQIDASGRSWLWAGTRQGLARFDGQTWTLIRDVPGLPGGPHIGMALIRAGQTQQLWVGSNHNGISRLDVTDPMRPQLLDPNGIPPPPNRMVYSIAPDSRGRVWICTNHGIQRLTPDGRGGYQSRVYRRRDGLVHEECNIGAQKVDVHDRYWVGTMGGLGMYDPALEARPASAPGPLLVTALGVDGVTRALPDRASLHLAPGDHRVEIDYSLLSGQREDETRYRSRLQGYETEMTPWSEERRRVFTNLPPGRYALRIEARDFNGSTRTLVMPAITIAPLWWQRGWVQAVLALLALLAVIALVMAYNRRLRSRQRQLRRIVADRTRELRAANERLTAMSYLDPLTGVANRRRLTEVLEAEIARAAAQKLPLGLIMVDIDHFKNYNDRHGHLAGDVALRAVSHALNAVVRPGDLVARFGGEEFVCLLVAAELAEVMEVAERMRASVEALPPRAIGNDVETLTMSAGVFSVVPDSDDRVDGLLAIVDAALYEAKAGGRNRVARAANPI
ncbi:ligand-binding sensor domain-containing diguanylate cyclase [Thermomonas sp.]|uniref:ligand-binding sensor domain-containing diguanylate cyclase n=1 Tax=Thermomonas sp. TaxID=1971895 RepID=UPI00260E0D08|nr:ligand-binding sensor domain-containing diguanylate cyclase [Thermomonas sp.]MCO5055753.1 diguanylate cyclase [Thermomonas sp.]